MGILDWLFGCSNPNEPNQPYNYWGQANNWPIGLGGLGGMQNIYGTSEYFASMLAQQQRYCYPYQPQTPESPWDGKLWYPLANKPQTLVLWYPLEVRP